MGKHTDLLIVGAGPYGLSLAAYIQGAGLNFTVVGKPLDFWKNHMPRDMVLRSGVDWHLDPQGVHTFEAFAAQNGLSPEKISPVPIALFLAYAGWFQTKCGIQVQEHLVERLDVNDGVFQALLDNGQTLTAKRAVLALGFSGFEHLPPALTALLPEGRFSHTAHLVEFSGLKSKRCLIVGGRQSALEWAALIREQGARQVHVTHRHDTPPLKRSDWSWVPQLAQRTVADSGWFRRLPPEEKNAITQRFWSEGRLKLEPWLAARLDHPAIRFWPHTEITGVVETSDGAMAITLNQNSPLHIDHVVLATGYRVNLGRVPFLARGNCLPHITTKNGFPVLDEHFQSSLRGLFFTSFAATQDFGPFFGFTVGCTAASTALGQYLRSHTPT